MKLLDALRHTDPNLFGPPVLSPLVTSRTLPALTAAALTAAAVLVSSGAAVANDTPIVVPTSANLTITGHGNGHGHGLSQWGAEQAASLGLGWKRILGFYYPGTKLGRAGGKIRVLISGDTTKDVSVEPQPALRLHRIGGKGRSTFILARVKPKASRWRILPKAEKSLIEFRQGRSHGWHRWASFPGSAEFTAGAKPITLHFRGRSTASYYGSLRSVDGQTVNVVSLERYTMGVVPSEVFPSWPADALRAQAVAARTYAAFERAAHSKADPYDICDTSACQAYGGAGDQVDTTDAAVRATAGRVVSYGGKPAFAQFSASNGGFASDGGQPYLVAQPDPYDAASADPNHTWTVSVTDQIIETAYPTIGDLQSITLGDRDGNGEWGGRIGSVTLAGSLATVTVSGDAFRSALGLMSTWFTLTAAPARTLEDRSLWLN
jgi:SpoIID/LytB domain protein